MTSAATDAAPTSQRATRSSSASPAPGRTKRWYTSRSTTLADVSR
jgi:hypothetical protein